MNIENSSLWWRGQGVRLCIAVATSAYFLYYAYSAAEWHFIDNVNLLIHEAGHWIFLPFGDFLHVLGGSLFQTIFPLIYIIYFYLQRQYFSASLLIFWVGQNLINVSIYASDAVVMQLPLLGGDNSGHDWNYLLSDLHLLPYTSYIGHGIFGAGLLVTLLAVALSIITSQSETSL